MRPAGTGCSVFRLLRFSVAPFLGSSVFRFIRLSASPPLPRLLPLPPTLVQGSDSHGSVSKPIRDTRLDQERPKRKPVLSAAKEISSPIAPRSGVAVARRSFGPAAAGAAAARGGASG